MPSSQHEPQQSLSQKLYFGIVVLGIAVLAVASLYTTVSSSFVDDTEAEFDSGTYSNTDFDSGNGWVELSATTTGSYTSQIFDAGSVVDWDTISWTTQQPFYKELPDNMATETAYADGNVGMARNVFLLHLNEASGTIEDTSGNNNDSITISGATQNVDGRFGKGVSFDGSNDYVSFGDISETEIATNLSVEVWFKINGNSLTSGNANGIINDDDGYDNGWRLIVDSAGQANWQTDAGSLPNTLSEVGAITYGEWHHMVGTYDGSVKSLYINGALSATTSMSGNIPYGGGHLEIGRGDSNAPWTYNFNGVIDEVAVYDTAVLTADDVLDHYRRGANRLKLKVRTCDDASCSGEEFVGVDATTSTFFSELDNGTTSTPSMGIASTTAANRYFQYYFDFESDTVSSSPELLTVTMTTSTPDATWDGGGGDDDWCTADNWDTDTVPTSDFEVVVDTAVTVTTSGCSAGDVDFSSLTVGENNAATIDMGDVVGTAGDVTIKGSGTFEQNTSSTLTFTGDFTVESGGTLTHADNSTTHDYSVDISAANIDIQLGATVDADGLGYDGNGSGDGSNGPAAGQKSGSASGGGGHGGDGGDSTTSGAGGTANCDPTLINTMGSSGGRHDANHGGDGGGHIGLTASGTITVNGTITADGQNGGGQLTGGGGGGGGIRLTANVVNGSPQGFTATGGSLTKWGGGGGGGCVGIFYTTSNTIVSSTVAIQGGTSSEGGENGGGGQLLTKQDGSNGDLYVENSSSGVLSTQATSTLTVDSLYIANNANYRVPGSKSLSPTTLSGDGTGTLTLSGSLAGSLNTLTGITLTVNSGVSISTSSTLEISDDATLTLGSGATISNTISTLNSGGALNMNSGATFTIEDLNVTGGTTTLYSYTSSTPLTLSTLTVSSGAALTHADNSTAQSHVVNIHTTGAMTIAGSVNVNERGYAGGANRTNGNGPGAGEYESSSLSGSGAGHGGAGGDSVGGATGGSAYCVTNDIGTIGSGGSGENTNTGGDGGGLIMLTASSTMNVASASLLANGGAGGSQLHGGGGAGGGIYLYSDTITGTPTAVSANGGSITKWGGGGGGGCIEVRYGISNSISSATATGGTTSGGGVNGSAGVVTYTLVNELPAATISTPTQSSASIVTVTSTVSDADNDATTMIVEYSTDGSTWASSTLLAVTETEGQGGVTTSTGNIAGIDTDNDGSVTFTTIEWNIEADLPDTDDTSVYLRFIPNDSKQNGAAATSSLFAIDTADPTVPSFVNVENITATSIDLIYPSTTSTDTNFVEYKIFTDTTAGIDGTEPNPITSSTNANLGNSNFNGNSGSSFTASSLTPNTTYYVNIFAYDAWGFSTSSATEGSTTTLAAVPTSLATSVTTTDQIAVSWNANSNPAGTTSELRLDDNTLVTSTTDVSFTHTSLSVNTQYTYKIRALNSNDQATNYTATTAAYTLAQEPDTVTAASAGQTTATVTWGTQSNPTSTQFSLYETNTSQYVNSATLAIGDTSASNAVTSTWFTTADPLTVTGLSASTEYCFAVTGLNGDSVPTATTTATCLTTSAVPVVNNNSNNNASGSPPPPPQPPSAPTVLAPPTQTIAAPPGVPMGVTVGNSTHTVTAGTPSSDGSVSITVESDPVTISLAPKQEQLIDTDSDGTVDFFVRYEEQTAEGHLLLTLSSIEDLEFAINQAMTETDEQTVMLSLNSPESTLVSVSNDPTFADTVFEPYTDSMQWTLTPGDGIKTVYVRFRTADGGTRDTFDTIILAGQGFDQGSTCPLGLQNAYKTPFDSAVYYITSLCTKRPFARANVYFTYFEQWSDVEVTEEATLEAVPDDTLGFMPWGPLYNPASGSLIKTPSDPKVYLLLSNTLYHIDNEEAAAFQFGPTWATWVEDVDDRLIDAKTTSETTLDTTTRPDTILLKYTDDPKVYQLHNHMLHWIPDEETFLSLGFRWDRVVTIGEGEVYAEGPQL